MGKHEENNVPLYLFHQGTNYKAYDFLGLHKTKVNGKDGMVFRVWAPDAKSVSVVGDFNQWDDTVAPMEKISDGVWECFLPYVLEPFSLYKFSIETPSGKKVCNTFRNWATGSNNG